MLNLHVIGSSSKGNGYLLESEHSALLIEAGVPLLEVKKAIGFNLSKISGCLLSHSHGDHAKFVMQYLKAGIKVYASKETIESIGAHHNLKPFTEKSLIDLGEFRAIAHPVVHDVPCHCFLIRHGSNTFCFVTDTHYVPYTFKGLTNIIIECNYSGEILEERALSGSVVPSVRDRVLRSHLSFETCRDFLLANDLSQVNNIVLIHLSDGNSDSRKFRDQMSSETGKAIHIASPGMKINFDSKPF